MGLSPGRAVRAQPVVAMAAAAAAYAVDGATMLKSVKKFSGSLEDNVEDFISAFDAVARAIAFPAATAVAEQIKALGSRMKGDAQRWFGANYPNNPATGAAWATVAAFEMALRNRFSTPGRAAVYLQRLFETDQLEGQTVAEYANVVRKLCERVDPAMPEN